MASPAERRASAESDLEKKLRLEKPVVSQTRTIFRRISQDLENAYAATGRTIDAKEYEDDFIAVLRPAYKRAEKEFGSRISDELIEEQDSEDPPFSVAIFAVLAGRAGISLSERISRYIADKNRRLAEFTRQTVPRRASLITATNQSEIDRSIAKAVAELTIEAPETITRSDIASRASRIIRDSGISRSQTIATTEIQTASEGAKSIEAAAFMDEAEPLILSGEAQVERLKEWHTQGDEKVRPAHVQADLQQVPADEPFIVDGEELMYPGDTSRGASAGNVINCRCSAIYTIDGNLDEIVTAESSTGSF